MTKYFFRTSLLGAMMVGSEPEELDEQMEIVARETLLITFDRFL